MYKLFFIYFFFFFKKKKKKNYNAADRMGFIMTDPQISLLKLLLNGKKKNNPGVLSY
jgi:hypothetical protein